EVNGIAVKMESFLKNIVFDNGDIPHFNDSSDGIAYSTEELLDYFEILGLESNVIPLSDSGYRSMKNTEFETKIDVAQLSVSYKPVHAHADSLDFLMYYNIKLFIITQGSSTFQINERLVLERSSLVHNSLTNNRENHSVICSSIRVVRLAVKKNLDFK